MVAAKLPDYAVSLHRAGHLIKVIYLPANRPVMIWGSPGVGKSAIVADIARALGYRLLYVHGSSMQECDIRGLPKYLVSEDGKNYTTWAASELVLICRAQPTILFFDELNRSQITVLNSLLPTIQERLMGMEQLPEHTRIIAACNHSGSGIVTLPEAMMDRFGHLFVKVDYKEFLKWGSANGLNACVIAHIQMHPDHLFSEERKKGEYGQPSPRKWEAVGKTTDEFMLNPGEFNTEEIVASVIGEVGEAYAHQFVAWMKVLKDCPPPTYIIANPDSAAVPEPPDYKYVISAALARHATFANFRNIVTYLNRLPAEFKQIAMNSATRRLPELCNTPEYINYALLCEVI